MDQTVTGDDLLPDRVAEDAPVHAGVGLARLRQLPAKVVEDDRRRRMRE
jgi:hypothetical protein